MRDKEVLNKLIKIVSNQQKIITKLAQDMTNETESKAQSFVKSMTSAWLANNGVSAPYEVSLDKSEDPNFHYEINLVLHPTTPGSVPNEVLSKYKNYMVHQLLQNEFLAPKAIKIEPMVE